jgi:hypothetical protein
LQGSFTCFLALSCAEHCAAKNFVLPVEGAQQRIPEQSEHLDSPTRHEGVSIVQCPKQLSPRHRATFKAVDKKSVEKKKKTADPNAQGAVAIELVEELYLDEYCIWVEIKAFRDSLPDDVKVLQADDVATLSELAEKVEAGKRRGAPLLVSVNKLVRAPEHGLQIHKGHAAKLLEHYQRALVEDVQQRVCELRAQLAELPPDDRGRVLTVSRSPYRIERVPCALSEKETQAITALYIMFDRFAWRARPGNIETKAFRVAQERFRFALASGVIVADDRTVISTEGVPRCYLGRTVRAKLRWVSEVSLMAEEVFETFYRPCSDLPDQDRFHEFGEWAAPYAAYVVNFLSGARNEILTVMNQLFESAGLDPCDLVAGHTFAPGYIPDGAVPDEPVAMTPDELRQQHSKLRALGVDHLRRPRPPSRPAPPRRRRAHTHSVYPPPLPRRGSGRDGRMASIPEPQA